MRRQGSLVSVKIEKKVKKEVGRSSYNKIERNGYAN